MPKVILGDNPFFGISHLAPEKSREYLHDASRWEKAASIIKAAHGMDIDLLMVSSHKETPALLKIAGYDSDKNLPEICLVVPNVHEINATAASSGILGALKGLFEKNMSLSDLRPARLYQRVVLGNFFYSSTTHVALHNVVVDMLVGLDARFLLSMFCRVTRLCGFKPVLITLNPLQLMALEVHCEAICCYYNIRGYNVCDDPETVITAFEKSSAVNELWAMGVVASGAVSQQELADDMLLRRFTRVIVASTKIERIDAMRCLFQNE